MNDRQFETRITGHLPPLRAYAALTDRHCDSDDAVAETLSRRGDTRTASTAVARSKAGCCGSVATA